MNRMLMKKKLIIHSCNRKIRVLVQSYEKLILKIEKSFIITEDIAFVLKLDDGSEIDEEYFDVLEDDTNIYINFSNESPYGPLLKKMDDFLTNYSKRNIRNIDEKLNRLLSHGDFNEIFGFLGSISLADDSKLCLTKTKNDHQSWFEGLNTKFVTKEAVLRNSAETRMRSYFQKIKKELDRSGSVNKISTKNFLCDLHSLLKKNKFHSFYFDREACVEKRLCSETGKFKCFGEFDCKECSKFHVINPYESKESRVVFSTWNLDHVIEKSRSIVPALKKALESPENDRLNVDYFYNLLFKHVGISHNDDSNLKLVHIVCHNKNPHCLQCDENKIFKKGINFEDEVDSGTNILHITTQQPPRKKVKHV